MAVLTALALGGCGGGDGGSDTTTSDPDVKDSATAAKDLRALADYCDERKAEDRADAVMSNERRFVILDGAAAYEADPTPELADALRGVDGCSAGTDDAVTAALSGEDPTPPNDELEQRQDEAAEELAAEPDGKFELQCDYLLGDSLDDSTFVAGGDLTNTGNVGIVTKVKVTWDQLGSDPVAATRTVRVPEGQTRDVQISVPADGSQVDAHQSADSQCESDVQIVNTFGD